MSRLPSVSGAQAVRAFERLGYEVDRQRGSHIVLRQTVSPHRRLVVPDHQELAKGTLRALIRQAGLTGRVPKDGRWKARYQEPAVANGEDLPELPDGWAWTTVDALQWDGGYGTSQKCRADASGPPVLRIPNVQNESLRFDDLKFATAVDDLPPDGVLLPGDFVFIRTNGSKSLIGLLERIRSERLAVGGKPGSRSNRVRRRRGGAEPTA